MLGSMATIVILSFVIFYKKREPQCHVTCTLLVLVKMRVDNFKLFMTMH
jgi:hypothetical protein